jgi:macrolide-specific efflux system membrane fusion protein
VLRLVAIERLRAEGFVRAEAATNHIVGRAAWFTLGRVDDNDAEADGAPPIAARIAFVSPEVDPVTRQVRVWAEIDNTDGRLRPGQQGRLVIPRPN